MLAGPVGLHTCHAGVQTSAMVSLPRPIHPLHPLLHLPPGHLLHLSFILTGLLLLLLLALYCLSRCSPTSPAPTSGSGCGGGGTRSSSAWASCSSLAGSPGPGQDRSTPLYQIGLHHTDEPFYVVALLLFLISTLCPLFSQLHVCFSVSLPRSST